MPEVQHRTCGQQHRQPAKLSDLSVHKLDASLLYSLLATCSYPFSSARPTGLNRLMQLLIMYMMIDSTDKCEQTCWLAKAS